MKLFCIINRSHYAHMETTTPDLPVSSPVSRAGAWPVRTALVHAISLPLYPAFICGCHFHISALIFSLIPIGWGFCLLVSYETWGERVTAYVATVLSFAWIYFAWDSNIQFIHN